MKRELLVTAFCPHLNFSTQFAMLIDPDENETSLWANSDRLAAGLAEILSFKIEPAKDGLVSVSVYFRHRFAVQFSELVDSRTYLEIISDLLRNHRFIRSLLVLTGSFYY